MDASQVTVDILNNPRYQGAIESISWLTNWVDAGFAGVITFVAFFIISVAMLKNVLAGAYCAFPKFWDKVDMAHKEVEGQGWIQQFRSTFGGQGIQQINMGTFSKAIMRILPNIKTLTDFDNDTLAAKQYFIAAIPQMCLVIIIGAFIYNGYYRDVAAKVVDFGSEMFYRVVLEADPIALFDQITNTAGRPEFSTNNSVDEGDKFINRVSQEVYTAIIGTYNDINTAEQKSALATQAESWVQQTVGDAQNAQYVGKPEWRAKVNATLVLSPDKAPDLTYMNKESDDGLTVQRAYAKPISDFSLASNKEIGKSWYVRVIVNFTKVPVSDGKVSQLADITLHLPKSSFSGGNPASITLPSGTVAGGKGWGFDSNLNNNATVNGKKFSVNGSKITVTGWSQTTAPDSVNCSIYYEAGGKIHTVTRIVFDAGNSNEIRMSSSKVADFKYADGPKFDNTDNTEEDTKK